MGAFLLYIFFFVIGLPADLYSVIKNVPLLFAFCIVMALCEPDCDSRGRQTAETKPGRASGLRECHPGRAPFGWRRWQSPRGGLSSCYPLYWSVSGDMQSALCSVSPWARYCRNGCQLDETPLIRCCCGKPGGRGSRRAGRPENAGNHGSAGASPSRALENLHLPQQQLIQHRPGAPQ